MIDRAIDVMENYSRSLALMVVVLLAVAVTVFADKGYDPDRELVTNMIMSDVPEDSIAYAMSLPRSPVVDFESRKIVPGSQYLAVPEDLSAAIIFTFNDSLNDMLVGQVVYDNKKKSRGP